MCEMPQRPRPLRLNFRRKPTATEMQNTRLVAIAALDRAVAQAEAAVAVEPPFLDVRARLCHEAALAVPDGNRLELLDRAAHDWARLRQLADDGAVKMTDWERALISILSSATEAAREERAQALPAELLERGRNLLERVARDSFEPGAIHHDIKVWREVAAAIDADGADTDLPEIDFVTVE